MRITGVLGRGEGGRGGSVECLESWGSCWRGFGGGSVGKRNGLSYEVEQKEDGDDESDIYGTCDFLAAFSS